MSLYFLGGKAHFIGALTEPSTYDADTSPVDVQLGAVYYAQGERRVGSGKAFEFAEYGAKFLRPLVDNEGIERYGVQFYVGEDANVVFVAPTDRGDIVLQTNFLATVTQGNVTKLGENHTTGGEIHACYVDGKLTVYLTDISQTRTMLRIFVGKDNAI